MPPPLSSNAGPEFDPPARPSLSESYRTVAVPLGKGGFWRKTAAFAGPGYMVAVGYMDPGNWATDLAGGSAFGYTLLAVVLLSTLMAILLQTLSARLGIAAGLDLAQACRQRYSRPVTFVLPPRFSLTQLQRLYEMILGTELDKRNFRKKILAMDLLVETDEVEQGVRHRAARLYKFDRRKYDRLAKQGFEFAM